jgi:hypothetical protein
VATNLRLGAGELSDCGLLISLSPLRGETVFRYTRAPHALQPLLVRSLAYLVLFGVIISNKYTYNKSFFIFIKNITENFSGLHEEMFIYVIFVTLRAV